MKNYENIGDIKEEFKEEGNNINPVNYNDFKMNKVEIKNNKINYEKYLKINQNNLLEEEAITIIKDLKEYAKLKNYEENNSQNSSIFKKNFPIVIINPGYIDKEFPTENISIGYVQ